MKTITITLTVPDDVSVHVQQGAAAKPERPFVEREPPPYPGGGCTVHDVQWKLVPAGVSRTKTNADGTPKRYNAFWACPERGCDQQPPREERVIDELPF